MLELKIKRGRKHVPLFDLPTYMGSRQARIEIGDTIDSLMAFLDDLSGDPDLENDTSDFEHSGDDLGDQAWIEWSVRGKHKEGRFGGERVARDHHGNMLHEDDEDSDPAEEDDDSGQCTEDEISSGYVFSSVNRPGCEISDPGEREEEACPTYGLDQSKVPTGHSASAETATVREALDEIRTNRCIKIKSPFGGIGWRLINTRAVSVAGHPANNFL